MLPNVLPDRLNRTFCIERSSALLGMERSIALVSCKGRSLFWHGKLYRSFVMERELDRNSLVLFLSEQHDEEIQHIAQFPPPYN
ncbi:MAG: hypothetical protein MUE44_23570 [Oscillatoriaceae cyanobacterium Prado104]|nr:hypothetical protein [Oscillatoriaceae cyanobacterium Prado104]